MAAVAVADRVVVGVVAASAAAVIAAVAAHRAVASASGDQTVAAIGLRSKGCRRQCPGSRVRVPNLAIGLAARVRRSAIGRAVLAARARRLAIDRVVLAARAHSLAIGRGVALVVRVRRLATVVRVRAARVVLAARRR